MAATATANQTITLTVLPQISPETRAKLAQERKKLAADPSAIQVPADLSVNAKWVFRTRPGTHRRVTYKLPLPPDEANYPDTPSRFQFALRTWGRLVAQPMYPTLKRAEAIDAAKAKLTEVFEHLGSDLIVFVPVRRSPECYYPTDDEVLAGFLRDLIAGGKEPFDKVYEVSGRTRIVVGDTAFPNTEGGRRLAFAHMAEHGGEMKIVEGE